MATVCLTIIGYSNLSSAHELRFLAEIWYADRFQPPDTREVVKSETIRNHNSRRALAAILKTNMTS